MTPRELAIRAIERIDEGGAYANLVLPKMLDDSGLERRDRALVTEMVYGATRMQRALDHLIEPYLLREVDPPVRAALRIGAYQLTYMRVPDHAAVAATVDAVVGPSRKLVNAVLRRVAENEPTWASDAARLSYPDWIVERLTDDLGRVEAIEALEVMNTAASATERDDGYTQDLASQWVAELTKTEPGMSVVDLCAGPGGKTTAMASSGGTITAIDQRPRRARLVKRNAEHLGSPVEERIAVVAADGARPPLRPGVFDRVLVDAPCTGLGALRRRADARWRIEEDGIVRLAEIQRSLVDAAVGLLAPGGILIYSVCTITNDETLGIDRHLADTHPELSPLPHPDAPWRDHGRGGLLLPQTADTDGMFVLRLRRPI